jgi:hypothetical protein
METNLITTVFKEFARFPELKAVQDIFRRKTSSNALYESLRDEVDNLAENSIMPDIKEYVFATSVEQIKNRINNLKDIFLMVEYGTYHYSESNGAEYGNFKIGISIGVPWVGNSKDEIEETLQMNNLYNLTKQMLEYLFEDDNCSLLEIFSPTTVINTIESEFAKQFLGRECIGWTFDLTRIS